MGNNAFELATHHHHFGSSVIARNREGLSTHRLALEPTATYPTASDRHPLPLSRSRRRYSSPHPSHSWRGLTIVAALLGFLSGIPNLAGAAENTEQDTWYDGSHDKIAKALNDTAIWFDSFFGDPRADIDREARAFVRVTLDGFLSGVEDESEFDVRFRGSLDLPRFEDKLKFVFTSDAETAITGEDLVDGDDSISRSRTDTTSGFGLAYLFRDTPTRKFAISGGLKGGISPDVYVNARYRYLYPLATNSAMRLTPTLYWKSDEGFGFSTLADLEHTPDPDTLWRLSLFGDYGEDTDGLEWKTQASWLRRLDPKSAISVRTGIKGETEPREILKEGWVSFRYRRNFLRPWLYYEVEPGLSWHEKEDYDTEPTLALRLEVQFYKD